MYPLVVTGATDGIGREFAKQLAKAGFNIVLVSRSTEKLGVVAAELGENYSYLPFYMLAEYSLASYFYSEQTYKVSTKTQSIDFDRSPEY